MAGKGGGAWKVAYADFVTAMMAFFMVMWITGQSEEVKEAVAHHFQDPFATLVGAEGSESVSQLGKPHARPVLTHDDESPDRRSSRPMLVQLGTGSETATGTVIYFTDESAELDQAAKDRLGRLVPVLMGKPQKIEIRGHSSRRPLPEDGPYRTFWELSYARCLATMKHLEEQGIAPERMRLSQAGVYEPQSVKPGRERGRHSRVEVHLLDEVAHNWSAPESNKPAEKKVKRAAAGGRQGEAHAAEPAAHNPPESKPAPAGQAAAHAK